MLSVACLCMGTVEKNLRNFRMCAVEQLKVIRRDRGCHNVGIQAALPGA